MKRQKGIQHWAVELDFETNCNVKVLGYSISHTTEPILLSCVAPAAKEKKQLLTPKTPPPSSQMLGPLHCRHGPAIFTRKKEKKKGNTSFKGPRFPTNYRELVPHRVPHERRETTSQIQGYILLSALLQGEAWSTRVSKATDQDGQCWVSGSNDGCKTRGFPGEGRPSGTPPLTRKGTSLPVRQLCVFGTSTRGLRATRAEQGLLQVLPVVMYYQPRRW